MLEAWWQHDVAEHLMDFYADMRAGKRPALVLQAPPQHGKTEQVSDFVAWVAGQNPDIKTIFASYSEDLGIKREHVRCNVCLTASHTGRRSRRRALVRKTLSRKRALAAQ